MLSNQQTTNTIEYICIVFIYRLEFFTDNISIGMAMLIDVDSACRVVCGGRGREGQLHVVAVKRQLISWRLRKNGGQLKAIQCYPLQRPHPLLHRRIDNDRQKYSNLKLFNIIILFVRAIVYSFFWKYLQILTNVTRMLHCDHCIKESNIISDFLPPKLPCAVK